MYTNYIHMNYGSVWINNLFAAYNISIYHDYFCLKGKHL